MKKKNNNNLINGNETHENLINKIMFRIFIAHLNNLKTNRKNRGSIYNLNYIRAVKSFEEKKNIYILIECKREGGQVNAYLHVTVLKSNIILLKCSKNIKSC